MTAADSDSPEVAAYIQGLKNNYGDEIAGAGPSVFTYGYYTGMTALIKALEASGGDVADQSKLQAELAKTTLSGDEAPWGDVKLDDEPPGDLERLPEEDRRGHHGRRRAGRQTFAQVNDVDQTFNGAFSADTPAPDRENPKCEAARPRRGSASPRPCSFAKYRWLSRRQTQSRRSSASRGSTAASAASTPCATSTSTSRPGERRAVLGPNGAGKSTLFNLISGRVPPTPGASSSSATT